MCDVMMQLIKLVVSQKEDLTEEERNLIAVAFKNQAGQMRGSCRFFWVDADQALPVRNYKAHLQGLLIDFCQSSLRLFSTITKVPAMSSHSTIFALKIQADFQRYLAEAALDSGAEAMKQSAAARASELYQQSLELSEKNLMATDPLRLGVALNYAVFSQEILKDTKQAQLLAKTAFSQSINKLDEVEDDQYTNTTLLMQLLRDNWQVWAVEQGHS